MINIDFAMISRHHALQECAGMSLVTLCHVCDNNV